MTDGPTIAPGKETPLSVSAYARRRQVSHTAVQRAIADGRLARSLLLEPGRPPQLLPSLADLEWEAHTSPAHARGQESFAEVEPDSTRLFPATASQRRGPTADDYRRSLVLEKVVKTKLAQVRLDEQQGRLIDAAEAGQSQFEIARLVRNQLQELPDRLADELALERDAHRVRSILAREIDDVLRKLARRLDPSVAIPTATPAAQGSPAAPTAPAANKPPPVNAPSAAATATAPPGSPPLPRSMRSTPQTPRTPPPPGPATPPPASTGGSITKAARSVPPRFAPTALPPSTATFTPPSPLARAERPDARRP